jgi:serpin B
MAFFPIRQNESPRQLLHPEFALSHDHFAFRLLQSVVQQDPVRNNKLISPLSMYLTLGMLYNGAAHETKDSFAGALRAETIELPNFNSFCKEALQQLPLEDDHVDFTVTNAIWYNKKKLTPLPLYQEMMQNFYYTPIQPLNFGSRDASAHVNQWVAENTRHEINGIAGKLNSSDAMVVVNALYFKAPWVKPFVASETKTADFYRLDVAATAVRFMHQNTILNTFSDTAFTMVEMPCGAGKNYSLFALMPADQGRPIESWITDLNPEKLNYAIDRMTPQFLDFYLPSWESNYAINDERAVLSSLGLSNTCTPTGSSDFSNMFGPKSRKVCISQVFHQTHLRINEDGMVASTAANAQGAAKGDNTRASLREMRFNRPFVYFLMEKQRNLILMTGIVNDPTLLVQPVAASAKPAARRHRSPKKRHSRHHRPSTIE